MPAIPRSLSVSIENEADEAAELREEEANVRMKQLEEEVIESTALLVEDGLKNKLANASLRVDGSISLDI
jgi:hypothetical protein